MTITIDNLPALQGTTFQAAKEWFAQLRPHASGVYIRGWHLDDPFEGTVGVTPEATRQIAETARQIRENSRQWADASVAYDLCGDVKVQAEQLWPGFVADVFTSASRTGYVSIPGRELPNFVIEEYDGEFFLLEFTTVGPISECPLFRMSRLEGARFSPGSAQYIDVSAAVVLEDTTRDFDEIDVHDEVIVDIYNATTPRAAVPRL